jgi:hypothetical protein
MESIVAARRRTRDFNSQLTFIYYSVFFWNLAIDAVWAQPDSV